MRQDLRHAFRLLRLRPGVSALVVATLASGIAASTIAFTLADAILWHPLPFQDADRLVKVRFTLASGSGTGAGAPLSAWPAGSQILDGLYPYALDSAVVRLGDEPLGVTIGLLSPGLLDALGVAPAWGRGFTRDEFRPGSAVVIVSADLWSRVQATTPATREPILVVDGSPRTIVGAMPRGFDFPVGRVSLYEPDAAGVRSAALGKLKSGLTAGEAQTFARGASSRNGNVLVRDVSVSPFVTLNPVTSTTLRMITCAAALLLLIAVANAANVLLSEAVRRDAELVLRASIGASWPRLARQLATETLLVSALAAGLALLASSWALRGLVTAVPYLMSFQALRPIALDWRALVWTGAAATMGGLGAASFAVARARRINPQMALRGQNAVLPAQHRLRSLLTVAQIAVALALVACAAILGNSLMRLGRVDPGFDAEHLVRIGFQLPDFAFAGDQAERAALEDLRSAAAHRPDVEGATLSYAMPPSLDNWPLDSLEAADSAGRAGADTVWFGRVDASFLSTLGVPVLAGRDIDSRDQPGSLPTAIVSRALAERWWPNGDAIGRRFREGKDAPWRTIVGVAGNVTNGDMDPAHGLLAFYTPRAQSPEWWYQGLTVRTRRPLAEIGPELRALVRRILPEVPVTEVTTAPEMIRNASLRVRFATALIGAAAAAALGLCLVGVYGAFWYAVGQRTREIGVRLALGAAPRQVMWMVIQASARVTAAGLVLGLPLALLLNRSLRSLLYGVSPSDPLTLGVVAGLVAITALGATYLPARRASRVDPLEALRHT